MDPEWKIPHFEKMLYDNAQSLGLYANIYKEFKNPLFRSTVNKTFDFLQKRMENSQGGYFSAVDADNEDGEGRYYVFTLEEIKRVAGKDIDLLVEYYRINLDNPIENLYYHLNYFLFFLPNNHTITKTVEI